MRVNNRNRINCPMSYYRRRRRFVKNLFKNQNKECIDHTHNVAYSEFVIENEFAEFSEPHSCAFDLENDDQFEMEFKETSIANDICQWALKYSVNHNAVSVLLKILRGKLKQDVPKDARTLLKTPRDNEIEIIDGGKLWYNGIGNCLRNIFSTCNESITVFLNVNIDGLPLHKSALTQFWPILMNIVGQPDLKPMVIAIFMGTSKPKSIFQFLSKFVIDYNDMCRNGINLESGVSIKVQLNAFIMDKPARALVKCMLDFFVISIQNEIKLVFI